MTSVSDESLERRADLLVDARDRLLEDLVSLRKEHKLSQQTVAERMGVSQPTVAAFERYDANPTVSSIIRYAMAVDALLDIKVVGRALCVADDRSRQDDCPCSGDTASGTGNRRRLDHYPGASSCLTYPSW